MKKMILLFGAGIAMPVLLMVLALFIPPASLLFLPVFFAFPAAFSMMKYEKTALLYGVVMAILSYFILGFYGIAISLTGALFGSLAGKCIAEDRSMTQTVGCTGIGFGIMFILLMAIYKKMTGNNPVDDLFTLCAEAVTEAMAQMADPEVATPEIVAGAQQELLQAFSSMRVMFPTLLFTASAIFGYLTLWIVSLLSVIVRKTPRFVPHFSMFRCSIVTIWIYFITWILSMLTTENSVLYIALENISSIISFLFLICAMSLADYWMKRKHWIAILRILGLGAIYITSSSPLISIVTYLIAFVDARANLRGLKD